MFRTEMHPAFYMPAPKGYECPACKHSINVHREHGCECTAPHGRIMPEDGWPQRPDASCS